LTVATIVGVLATIGLMALGLKQYALLIGVITGIGNLIPYLGPVMGATPAVLYVLFSESYDTGRERLVYLGLIVALFAFLQVIEGFFLQPRIVGRNAQLHPVAVIFALACGAPFGVIGMIIALPVAAIIRVLLKEFFWDAREAEWHRTTGKVRLDDVGGPGTPA
jgi:predicted PurR-regulated permease PerM